MNVQPRRVYVFPLANGFASQGKRCDCHYSLPAFRLAISRYRELRVQGVDAYVVIMNNRVRNASSGRLLVDVMCSDVRSLLGDDYDERRLFVTSLPSYGGVMDARTVANEVLKTRLINEGRLAETILVGYSGIIRDYIEIVYKMVARQVFAMDWEFKYEVADFLPQESEASIKRYELQTYVANFVSKAPRLLFSPYYFANLVVTLPRRRHFTVTVVPAETR